MIVEFAGLPGAGKSSLEKAVIKKLESRGWSAKPRDAAVRSLAARCSPFPRDRCTISRRLSTLCYKSSLLWELLSNSERLLSLMDFLSIHRTRAALRVIEDLRLHRLGNCDEPAQQIINTSEGLAQHVIALSAWRKKLGSQGHLEFSQHLRSSNFAADSVLVVVSTEKSVAEARLTARGIPELWPRQVEPGEVLTLFSQGLAALMEVTAANSAPTVIVIDGNSAPSHWTSEADEVVRILTQKLSNPV